MFAVFNITNRCNFECATCIRGYPGTFRDLSVDTAAAVMPQLRRYGWTGVVFTGGEPILHPRFPDLIVLAAEQGLCVGVVTNGWLHEKYRPLLRAHLRSISYVTVSIDGAVPETHEAIRGMPGSFDRALAAISGLKQDGLHVRAALCLNRRNYGELEAFVEKFHPLVDCLVIASAIPCDHNLDVVLTAEQQQECRARVGRLQPGRNIYVSASVGMHYGLHFCAELGVPGLTVNYDSNVVFCCDTAYEGAILGNLNDESLPTLLGRQAETTARLFKARIEALSQGELPPPLNTCAFCNTFLREIIVPVQPRKAPAKKDN